MKRVAMLMLLVCAHPASAQLRVRPKGELHMNDIAITFEATPNNLFSVVATRNRTAEATCLLSPSAARSWTDSTERVALQPVDPPKAPERIEYVGPVPDANCS